MVGDTKSQLRFKDVRGLKMTDIEKPQGNIKSLIEVGSIDNIIADALKRIARSNLREDKGGDKIRAGKHLKWIL